MIRKHSKLTVHFCTNNWQVAKELLAVWREADVVQSDVAVGSISDHAFNDDL